MSTHLILTVGTNPLPVFVATCHLLKHFQEATKLTFIYSKETEKYKNNIARATGINKIKSNCV